MDPNESDARAPAPEPSGVSIALGQAMPRLDKLPVLTEAAHGEPLQPGAASAAMPPKPAPLPVISVVSGPTLPLASPAPVARPAGVAPVVASASPHLSTIGAGLSFTGTASIDGSITVAGEVQGDLRLAESDSGVVTVTESGTVVGDIHARNISVLGNTVGTLDAAGGKVSLHDTASVSGRIRYAHLQVNGADLNAQLERVRSDDEGEPRL